MKLESKGTVQPVIAELYLSCCTAHWLLLVGNLPASAAVAMPSGHPAEHRETDGSATQQMSRRIPQVVLHSVVEQQCTAS